jgi:hypothetical protein
MNHRQDLSGAPVKLEQNPTSYGLKLGLHLMVDVISKKDISTCKCKFQVVELCENQ